MASTLRVDNIELTGKAGLPIGFIYTQLPGSPAPDTLFTGTWTNVSSSYAGDFFRAEGGGDALAFDDLNATEQLDASKVELSIISDEPGPAATSTYKLQAHIPSVHWGVLTERATPGGTAWGSIVTKCHNDRFGSAAENRPINRTVRIWKRTA